MEIKPAMVAITAFVVITVIAAVLMPVLGDATKTEDTFTNDGYYDMIYSDTDDITLVWDHTAPGAVSINGVSYTIPTTIDQSRVTIMCGDEWVVRYAPSSNEVSFWASSGSAVYGSKTNGIDITVTATNGTVTAVNTASTPATATSTYTELFCIDPDGSYVMKKANEAAYLNKDSKIYAIGTTQLTGNKSSIVKFEGDIENGVSGYVYRVSGATVGDIEMHYTESSNHIDLYMLDKITATVDDSGTETDVTYSYFIVPAEVTAEKSVHLTSNESAILLVIPALLIIAIIIGILAYAIRMRE